MQWLSHRLPLSQILFRLAHSELQDASPHREGCADCYAAAGVVLDAPGDTQPWSVIKPTTLDTRRVEKHLKMEMPMEVVEELFSPFEDQRRLSGGG